MVGLTVRNFLSAATGFAIAAALAHAFRAAAPARSATSGSIHPHHPLLAVAALAMVAFFWLRSGCCRRSGPTSRDDAGRREADAGRGAGGEPGRRRAARDQRRRLLQRQRRPPLRGPNHWTNLIQTWAIFSLALGLAIAFGRMIGREREGWALLGVMVLFPGRRRRGGLSAEASGDPLMHALGVTGGNMEGKEVRSARRCPPSGPCSPPAPRPARSPRCTPPSCRWAASSSRAHADRRGNAGRRRLGALRHRAVAIIAMFVAG